MQARRKWVPHLPTPKQREFLDLGCDEALYGGAAGGGKTDALLMAALEYVDSPGYAALLLRRTYADLALPGGLMPRAREWLGPTEASRGDQGKTWTFPSGATLVLSYLQHEDDKYRYQGSDFQFIGFDELTQFSETQYTYLFSRLRKASGVDIPLRMRAASNPGGVGHDWVKARFVESGDETKVFIPAKLIDNPYLDQESYLESLAKLDEVTRAQLEEGNWDVLPAGDMFVREKAEIVDALPANLEAWVRWWDLAASEGQGDYTVGALVARTSDVYYVADVVRGRWNPSDCDAMIRQTAALDKQKYPEHAIWIEQEPGSSGKRTAQQLVRMLAGYDANAETSTGSKTTRAKPFASQWGVSNVKLLRADWNKVYLDEMVAFPNGPHDDQVDASASAFLKLTEDRHETGSIRYA